MHIIELRSDNFKRLRAVRLHLSGAGVVEIVGKNAQGKSSVLDAVWAALGGERAAPDKPIRDDATKAEVYLDLGDIRVTRRWSSNDRSTLLVEDPDGTRRKSPQAVLDALVGRLSFDPLEFTRMAGKDQASVLKTLAGLDFAELDAARDHAFGNRTIVHREMKKLEGQLAATPPVDAPDDEVSIADLVTKHEAALAEIQKNGVIRRRHSTAEQMVQAARAKLVDLEKQVEVARAALLARDAELEVADDAVFGLVDPDATLITEQMKQIETTNARVRQRKSRRTLEVQLKEKAGDVAKLEREMETADEKKRALLNEARFPVAGLSVDGETVTFGGQPFKQASTAEQIRVGLAIGAALNPQLRVILVREGSSLDADAMSEVARWAKDNEMQVFLERVGESTSTGVLIEDGEVKG
jgi:DNA repair exonuclease SbcCD ATPase subunit